MCLAGVEYVPSRLRAMPGFVASVSVLCTFVACYERGASRDRELVRCGQPGLATYGISLAGQWH